MIRFFIVISTYSQTKFGIRLVLNEEWKKWVEWINFSQTLLFSFHFFAQWTPNCLKSIACFHSTLWGFPSSSDGKASACKAGDPGLIPGSGRSPGEGNGNPLQYPCLENSMVRGAWWAIVHGVTKSWTRLSGWHTGTVHFMTQPCPSALTCFLLLLLLSRFSHVRLCATPQMAAHQAPQSLGFSRQEHWSGLP